MSEDWKLEEKVGLAIHKWLMGKNIKVQDPEADQETVAVVDFVSSDLMLEKLSFAADGEAFVVYKLLRDGQTEANGSIEIRCSGRVQLEETYAGRAEEAPFELADFSIKVL
jgi:hypothetical protein